MWLGILGKRPRETGLTVLWFLCPGTAFSLACQLAGALVSLWRQMLSTGVFAVYVLHVSAVDGGRKGMSEGQCKPRGGQRVLLPSQQPGLPLGRCSCCGQEQSPSAVSLPRICWSPKLWLR